MKQPSRSIQVWHSLALPALAAASTLHMPGCAESAPEPPQQPAAEAQSSPSSLWHLPSDASSSAAALTGFDPTAQIAVIDEELGSERHAALRAAIEHARRTSEEARQRWLQSPAPERDRWAVKWAAPLADGRTGDPAAAVEYVWVRPVHWSPFRVEGVLASDPVNALESGRTLGELVSFPVEELADWVRYHTNDADGPRDGGFTIDVLINPQGRAPSAVPTAAETNVETSRP